MFGFIFIVWLIFILSLKWIESLFCFSNLRTKEDAKKFWQIIFSTFKTLGSSSYFLMPWKVVSYWVSIYNWSVRLLPSLSCFFYLYWATSGRGRLILKDSLSLLCGSRDLLAECEWLDLDFTSDLVEILDFLVLSSLMEWGNILMRSRFLVVLSNMWLMLLKFKLFINWSLCWRVLTTPRTN